MTPTVDLRHGDALAVLSDLPDATVDAVITDPPYSSGGMVRGDRVASVHTKYVQTDSISGKALVPFGGDTRDQRSYHYWSALWLSEALRVTKSGGVLCVFTDWRQLPVTSDAIQAGGWVWRGIIPWHKPNGRRVQGRFSNTCEYVVWGTAGPRALDVLGPVSLPGFFQINTLRRRHHIAEKPVELLRDLVQITPPEAVLLDPFLGAGSTGVAAVLEGRSIVGIDRWEHWIAVATERIRTAVQGQCGGRGDAAANAS